MLVKIVIFMFNFHIVLAYCREMLEVLIGATVIHFFLKKETQLLGKMVNSFYVMVKQVKNLHESRTLLRHNLGYPI